MKTVIYKSTVLTQCNCSCSGTPDIVVCLSSSLVASGNSFIPAIITATNKCCGRFNYTYEYYIEYDENLLNDPTYSLASTDIKAIYCNEYYQLFTAYVDANSFWLFDPITGILQPKDPNAVLWGGAAQFDDLPIYPDNGAALAGGLDLGDLYRTGGDPDLLCVVHYES